jgi:hypothetical protein
LNFEENTERERETERGKARSKDTVYPANPDPDSDPYPLQQIVNLNNIFSKSQVLAV